MSNESVEKETYFGGASVFYTPCIDTDRNRHPDIHIFKPPPRPYNWQLPLAVALLMLPFWR